MRIEYQYLKKGSSKPDTITLSDVPHVIKPGEPIPSKGDFVLLQYTSPKEKLEHFGHFEITARHFFYNPDGSQQDYAIFIVEDAPDLPETRFRE
jgi:hypothetical protein